MDEDGDALLFEVSDQPLDVAFHPSEPIVLAGEPPDVHLRTLHNCAAALRC